MSHVVESSTTADCELELEDISVASLTKRLPGQGGYPADLVGVSSLSDQRGCTGWCSRQLGSTISIPPPRLLQWQLQRSCIHWWRSSALGSKSVRRVWGSKRRGRPMGVLHTSQRASSTIGGYGCAAMCLVKQLEVPEASTEKQITRLLRGPRTPVEALGACRTVGRRFRRGAGVLGELTVAGGVVPAERQVNGWPNPRSRLRSDWTFQHGLDDP